MPLSCHFTWACVLYVNLTLVVYVGCVDEVAQLFSKQFGVAPFIASMLHTRLSFI